MHWRLLTLLNNCSVRFSRHGHLLSYFLARARPFPFFPSLALPVARLLPLPLTPFPRPFPLYLSVSSPVPPLSPGHSLCRPEPNKSHPFPALCTNPVCLTTLYSRHPTESRSTGEGAQQTQGAKGVQNRPCAIRRGSAPILQVHPLSLPGPLAAICSQVPVPGTLRKLREENKAALIVRIPLPLPCLSPSSLRVCLHRRGLLPSLLPLHLALLIPIPSCRHDCSFCLRLAPLSLSLEMLPSSESTGVHCCHRSE